MYKLDRTRKCKFAFGILTFIFLVIAVIGYVTGGSELLRYDFINERLASISMVVSFFCMVICALATITVHALEKDIAEWLEIVDKE